MKNNYTDSMLEQIFNDLIASPSFQEFEPRDDRLDYFAALGITSRELSHSSLLTYLFDPQRAHGLEDRFLKEFLRFLPDALRLGSKDGSELPSSLLSEIQKSENPQVITKTEDERIDVSVTLPEYDLMIGIEVKIYAGEGEKQLERYQNILERRTHKHVIMTFLTPHGQPPETGADQHSVPCLSLSWGDISKMLAFANRDNSSVHKHFIEHCVNHFRRRLDRNPPQAKAAADIFRNPDFAHLMRLVLDGEDNRPESIQKRLSDNPRLLKQFKNADDYRPTIGQIPKEKIEAMANRVFPEGVELDWYPVKTSAKEWKIYPKSDYGLYENYRPNFMIYHYPNTSWNWERRPAVVLVTNGHDWKGMLEIHDKLVAHDEGGFLSPSPKGLPSWSYWRHLMSTDGDDAPTELGYVIDNEAFDDEFLATVEARLRDIDSRLQRAWEAFQRSEQTGNS